MSATDASITPPRDAPARTTELDGLRGCAALSVVIFHMTCELFGAHMPWLANPVTALLFDGNLAVSIFFVLSGEALASGTFAGGDRRGIAKLALKRVPRLSIPILAATLVTVACLRGGLVFNTAAAKILGQTVWLRPWLLTDPTLFETVRFAFWDVYVQPSAVYRLMPFLWTMSDELLGSALVFILLALWHRSKRIDLILLLALVGAAVCDRSLYMCDFIAGAFFARLRSQGAFETRQMSRAGVAVSSAGLATCAAAYSWLSSGGYGYLAPLVAPLLLACIFLNPPALSVFRSRACAALGRLSFPIYLIQFPVLMSLTSWLVVVADRAHRLDDVTCLAIAGLSVIVTLVAAEAFMPVEHVTAWVGRRLVRFCFDRDTVVAMPEATVGVSAPTA